VQLGHDVTIFEALHKPGGVLVYGIPSSGCPRPCVAAEVDYLQKLGVRDQHLLRGGQDLHRGRALRGRV
jgi:NADPH-dependent glutamate synthase beta subunit-like oxidoreductase